MYEWIGKHGVKIYRDGSVVSVVPNEGFVGVQIRLDLPHEFGDLASEDRLVSMDMRGDLASGPEPLRVGDRVRVLEIRVENMRLAYVRLERLPWLADSAKADEGLPDTVRLVQDLRVRLRPGPPAARPGS